MPTYSKTTRQPVRNASTGFVEDRAKFKHRLDREDDEKDSSGLRVRPKNKSGAKKFGIEIKSGKYRWCHWYLSAKARDQGLVAYRNKYSAQKWRISKWSITPIENV